MGIPINTISNLLRRGCLFFIFLWNITEVFGIPFYESKIYSFEVYNVKSEPIENAKLSISVYNNSQKISPQCKIEAQNIKNRFKIECSCSNICDTNYRLKVESEGYLANEGPLSEINNLQIIVLGNEESKYFMRCGWKVPYNLVENHLMLYPSSKGAKKIKTIEKFLEKLELIQVNSLTNVLPGIEIKIKENETGKALQVLRKNNLIFAAGPYIQTGYLPKKKIAFDNIIYITYTIGTNIDSIFKIKNLIKCNPSVKTKDKLVYRLPYFNTTGLKYVIVKTNDNVGADINTISLELLKCAGITKSEVGLLAESGYSAQRKMNKKIR